MLCAGLDADLLAVVPAFSRHPSLKHLILGKNFNIKGRYGRRRTPVVRMVARTLLLMNEFPSSLRLLRVLEETLQKLVHLVQEEECVSWIVM